MGEKTGKLPLSCPSMTSATSTANFDADHPSSKPAQDNNSNDEASDRHYEVLVATSANIALTMLHRGKFLEDELQRALDHVRTSNEFLGKFVELLESVDEDREDGKERAGSWREVAERVKSVVKWGGRCDEEKKGGQDGAEKEVSIVTGESGDKPSNE
jgi:hypothetical protein